MRAARLSMSPGVTVNSWHRPATADRTMRYLGSARRAPGGQLNALKVINILHSGYYPFIDNALMTDGDSCVLRIFHLGNELGTKLSGSNV